MRTLLALVVVLISVSATDAEWITQQITQNDVDDNFSSSSVTLSYSQRYVRNQRVVWRTGDNDIMTWTAGTSALVYSASGAVHQLAMDWPLVVWERPSANPQDGLTAWQNGIVTEVVDGNFFSTNLSVSQGRALYSTDIGAGEASKAGYGMARINS